MFIKALSVHTLFVVLCIGCASSAPQPAPAAPAAPPPNGTSDETSAAPVATVTETAHDEPAFTTREVSYEAGGTALSGFIAYPAGDAVNLPSVLVVHEWWGLNDYARSRAAQLAGLGYVAMAIDMYGGGKNTTHPDDAKKFMQEALKNENAAAARFEAAKALLEADPRTDPHKVAAIGYCFGGGVVLAMVRRGSDLDLAASFHGSLGTKKPLKKGAFDGRIFVANGGADPFVPPEQVRAFDKEMKAADARYELVSYEGAVHGFTNPGATAMGENTGMPLKYDATADAASFERLTELLAEVFES